MTIAVLGAGPHGHQIAAIHPQTPCRFYDDLLAGHESVLVGASRHPWLVGAAWPKVRRAIAEKASEAAEGPYRGGRVFFPGSKIGSDVLVGDHTHIGWNAVVSHGCRVGGFVNICPGAVLAGEVLVEDDVFIGANATIIHGGIKIGQGAVIGAGAVVLDDVEPWSTVAGNPGRRLR